MYSNVQNNSQINYISNKRKFENDQSQAGNDLESFKKKKKVQGLMIVNKNPISILNELKPGLIYNIKEQAGPPHAPIFKVSVILNGKEYEGVGKSKKLAKSKAAANALKSFVQFPKADEFNGFQADTKTDFSSDVKGKTLNEEKSAQVAPCKGATMLMNELYPNAKYIFEENSKETSNRFKAIIQISGEEFVGMGSNKKRAKNAAAMVALTKLLAEKPNYSKMIQPLRNSTASLEQQAFADRVGRMVNEKFRDLMRYDTIHLKRKVLAGMVMTRDEAMNDMIVICVATGTKCINGENISASGTALNDMHAEIVSRRCLINFLYDQLRLQFTKGEEHNSVFEPRPDNTGFRLRRHIKFHLYISTAPCGDARIFSPNDVESVDRHSARSSRGRLRTKIESGEGTIPIKGNDIQTWDGILQGERLLTMSCSDKIARWNVLGLQGTLLSCFVDPIYLSSIVLGSLLNEGHMQRAIFGRLENTLQGLPPPYHLNRPYMCPTASAETRVAQRAPNFSVNWVIGYDRPEIINTVTGKPEVGVSRLCKRNFSKRFLDVCYRVTSIGNVDVPIPKIYADAKLAATPYNQAKEQLFRAFSKANLGSWIKKPLEQDQFQIEDDIF
ncbi:double-stranded RNA-specific editase Adar isoform X4 [Agrilus planipennis]|uniref:Double-stranded RNA-specific editase Adar isoform X4 n=1 Tax=Agrilus planipennis TaxID=224129 RepID=A0A1W4XI06_AGRPL|nr:double-stranded RNA-specific editase Adar isoform X4 [Agrilus planipennis]